MIADGSTGRIWIDSRSAGAGGGGRRMGCVVPGSARRKRGVPPIAGSGRAEGGEARPLISGSEAQDGRGEAGKREGEEEPPGTEWRA